MIELLVKLDDFLCDRYLKQQIQKYVDPSFFDFNLDKKDAVSDSVSQIIDSVDSLPMMGGDRVVVVENLQKLSKSDLEQLTLSLKKATRWHATKRHAHFFGDR